MKQRFAATNLSFLKDQLNFKQVLEKCKILVGTLNILCLYWSLKVTVRENNIKNTQFVEYEPKGSANLKSELCSDSGSATNQTEFIN